MHIGLYFGSFNPIHNGHLIIASYAQFSTELDQVWMVVSPQNPLKPSGTLLNEYHRLHLLNMAIDGDPNLKSTDIEFKLARPSYTVHTLAYLQEKYPQHRFSVIMGSDSLQNIENWKNYKTILQNHSIFVFLRPGYPLPIIKNATIIPVEAPLLQISSTEIRALIKAGKPIRYFVPDAVAKEIADNNYYK